MCLNVCMGCCVGLLITKHTCCATHHRFVCNWFLGSLDNRYISLSPIDKPDHVNKCAVGTITLITPPYPVISVRNKKWCWFWFEYTRQIQDMCRALEYYQYTTPALLPTIVHHFLLWPFYKHVRIWLPYTCKSGNISKTWTCTILYRFVIM